MEGQAPASPEHNYDQQGASEEAYSGYQMSGGMLVCDPAQGMDGMGEMGGDYGSQEHGEVAPMRRDLSGEASTWFPAAAESSSQSQEGSQENLPYEHQHHQQYSGFGGGAFGTGSGTWGGGGGSEDAAASEGGEWTGDAIVLEPVNPWDDYNYGGSVAVHTRIQTSKTGQQFQFLAKCQNVDRWSGWETPELAEAAAAAARALSQPHVRQNQELTRDAVEAAAGEGGGAGGSQPIKVGGRSRMPSDEIDKFSDVGSGVSDVGSAL